MTVMMAIMDIIMIIIPVKHSYMVKPRNSWVLECPPVSDPFFPDSVICVELGMEWVKSMVMMVMTMIIPIKTLRIKIIKHSPFY